MPSVITAGTASNTALNLTSDTSGELQLKTNNGATTALTLTTGGNINIPTTGARITGDMSNATVNNRLSFQTSTVNGPTAPWVFPNGTSNVAGIGFSNTPSFTNSSFLAISISSGNAALNVDRDGSGTFLPITISTGGTERLRIDTSGRVGIGTSSPTQSLDVAGNITGNDYIIRTTAGTIGYTGANGAGIEIYGSSSGTPNIVTVRTSNAERMRIDSSGNVGIGTSSPTQRLHVSTSSDTYIQASNTSGTPSNIFMGAAGGTNVIISRDGTTGDRPLLFYVGTAERMRITSGGSISVTQPAGQYTCDVTGGTTTVANGGTVDFANASGMLVVNSNNTGGVTIYLCGGGVTGAVASVVGQVGTFAYVPGIAGYRWTNNSGSSGAFGFFFVRTRATA